MSAAAELQRAVFAALMAEVALTTALGGPRIHDLAPARVQFPYITFGRTSITDWSTATERGAEHLIGLHVWSKGKGKREVLEIMEIVSARLHDRDLVLVGHHLVSLRQDYSEVTYDDDLSVHHGMLRFRALTESLA